MEFAFYTLKRESVGDAIQGLDMPRNRVYSVEFSFLTERDLSTLEKVGREIPFLIGVGSLQPRPEMEWLRLFSEITPCSSSPADCARVPLSRARPAQPSDRFHAPSVSSRSCVVPCLAPPLALDNRVSLG